MTELREYLVTVQKAGLNLAQADAIAVVNELRRLGRVRRLAVQPKEPPPFKEARQKTDALDETHFLQARRCCWSCWT